MPVQRGAYVKDILDRGTTRMGQWRAHIVWTIAYHLWAGAPGLQTSESFKDLVRW